ncbi:MAG TPA: LysR family transcriptional regulator, partial [Spongiibacteraceae bacterium]|nr:LysR family transcriptional regulator [Spongiibacteraceae bacterium]
MDTKRLRYFVAAAEEENLRRAAQRLHIVQPALSKQIAQLETELGCELF